MAGSSPVRRHWRARQREVSIPEGDCGDTGRGLRDGCPADYPCVRNTSGDDRPRGGFDKGTVMLKRRGPPRLDLGITRLDPPPRILRRRG